MNVKVSTEVDRSSLLHPVINSRGPNLGKTSDYDPKALTEMRLIASKQVGKQYLRSYNDIINLR